MAKAGLIGSGVAAAGVVMLASCASPPEQPQAVAPVPAPITQAPVANISADQCGAAAAQALIGRPKTEIPVPVHPELQRVACTTCAVTLDFNPRRLNIFFDAQTGIVKEARCG